MRSLRLQFIKLAGTRLLEELVHDELIALEADTNRSSDCSSFFANRGTVRALETFVWTAPQLEQSPTLFYLEANKHIPRLRLEYAAKTVFLEERILPLLTHRFSNLTSLSLTWENKDIPQTSLEYIGRMTSLEQLCLSAGEQYGWRHDWYVKHDIMREYVCQIESLKKLVFGGDTYSCFGFTVGYNRYYMDKWQRYTDISREDWTEEMFEVERRERMVGEATEYTRTFLQLC